MRPKEKKSFDPSNRFERPLSRQSDLAMVSELAESNAVPFFELPALARPSSRAAAMVFERENKWKKKKIINPIGLDTSLNKPIEVEESLEEVKSKPNTESAYLLFNFQRFKPQTASIEDS